MKKINILIITLLMLNNAGNSQITKDNWMLGGSINYSSIQRNSENYGPPQVGYKLNINPNVGYFFLNKLGGGVKVSVGKFGDKMPGTSDFNEYTDFNFGPYLRYYFLDSEKSVNILSEALYMYGFEKGNQNDPSSKNSFVFTVGPVIYFNSIVGMEFLTSYSTSKFTGIKGSNNTLMFGIGLQIHLEKEK